MHPEGIQMKRARPSLIRAAVFSVIAIGGMVVAEEFGQFHGDAANPVTTAERGFLWGGALVALVAGVLAVRSVARALREATRDETGEARGASLALVVTVIGYSLVLVLLLTIFEVNPAALLLGGAFTGVIIGIAAQQVLGNVFAGLVLVIVRPFTVGKRVYLRSTIGEYEGEIVDMGIFYTTIMVERGPVTLPNSAVLASAVGPGTQSAKDRPDDEDEA